MISVGGYDLRRIHIIIYTGATRPKAHKQRYETVHQIFAPDMRTVCDIAVADVFGPGGKGSVRTRAEVFRRRRGLCFAQQVCSGGHTIPIRVQQSLPRGAGGTLHLPQQRPRCHTAGFGHALPVQFHGRPCGIVPHHRPQLFVVEQPQPNGGRSRRGRVHTQTQFRA